MSGPSREEQKMLVRLWDETGRELERMRREKLRDMPYSGEEVDALLEAGLKAGLPSRTTSGLVEMQRIFMKWHLKQQRTEGGTEA